MRIGFFDIEASNLDADFGIILCASIKEYHGKVRLFRNHEIIDGSDRIITGEILEALNEFDILVTFSGQYFDFPWMNSKAIEYGYPRLHADLKHIDLYWTCKRNLKIHSGSLDSVCSYLGIEGKTHLIGKRWRRAMVAIPADVAYVQEHNRQDVIILEKLFDKVKKYISQIRALRW